MRSGTACHGRQLDLKRIRRVGRRLLEGVVERILVGLLRLWPAVVKCFEGIWRER